MSDAALAAQALLEPAATRVRDPRSGRSVWLAKMVQHPTLDGDLLRFTLQFTRDHAPEERARLQEAMERQIRQLGWEGRVVIDTAFAAAAPAAPAPAEPRPSAPPRAADPVKGMSGPGMGPHGGPIVKRPLDGVKHIVAVASGKGGVGKSTVATNLALALAQQGLNVGLMDADIYGPSLPLMMGVHGKPFADDNKRILPLEGWGIKCMSIGFLVDEKEPIIWRGPMVMGVVRQFLQDVKWEPLDVLVIDLPPGTGDAQLTLIQAVDLSGAVIVTTPQDVAVLDAVRGVEMFRKLDVPVLGVVENMSWIELPGGGRLTPFGQGGGARTAQEFGVPLLAQVPLVDGIRAGGDAGRPYAVDHPRSPFRDVADAVIARLGIDA